MQFHPPVLINASGSVALHWERAVRIRSSIAVDVFAIEIFDSFVCREGTVGVAQVSRPKAAAFSAKIVVYIAGIAYLVESYCRITVIDGWIRLDH